MDDKIQIKSMDGTETSVKIIDGKHILAQDHDTFTLPQDYGIENCLKYHLDLIIHKSDMGQFTIQDFFAKPTDQSENMAISNVDLGFSKGSIVLQDQSFEAQDIANALNVPIHLLDHQGNTAKTIHTAPGSELYLEERTGVTVDHAALEQLQFDLIIYPEENSSPVIIKDYFDHSTPVTQQLDANTAEPHNTNVVVSEMRTAQLNLPETLTISGGGVISKELIQEEGKLEHFEIDQNKHNEHQQISGIAYQTSQSNVDATINHQLSLEQDLELLHEENKEGKEKESDNDDATNRDGIQTDETTIENYVANQQVSQEGSESVGQSSNGSEGSEQNKESLESEKNNDQNNDTEKGRAKEPQIDSEFSRDVVETFKPEEELSLIGDRISDNSETDTSVAKVKIQHTDPSNEAPISIKLVGDAIDENSEIGDVVGKATAIDYDVGDSFQYQLTKNPNNAFSIDAETGVIRVANPTALDYESNDALEISIQVRDSGGFIISNDFMITVNDINDTPSDLQLSNQTINENSANGTTVGSLSVSDADTNESYIFELVNDAGGRFAVNSQTGTVFVANSNLLDYESKDFHQIVVRVTDSGGEKYTEMMTIDVLNINDAPDDLMLSNNLIAENSVNGTGVGIVSTSDQDSGDIFTYTLLNDAGGRFDINSGTGEITVANGILLDFETDTTHNITIEVTDGAGATYNESFVINITDVDNVVANDMSILITQNSSISHNLIATDPNDDYASLNFWLGSSTSHGSVTVNADGSFTFTPNNDYSGTDSFTYSVQNTLGEIDTATVNITVENTVATTATFTVGSEFKVNSFTSNDQAGPAIAALNDGGFVVAYTGHNIFNNTDDIVMQRFDLDGNAVGFETLVNFFGIDTQKNTSVTTLNDGSFVVTWMSWEGSSWEVFGQHFNANGTHNGPKFGINTTNADDQSEPSVTALNSGGFIVSWDSREQDGDKDGIFAQRFDSNANKVGPEFQVNTYTLHDQDFSTVLELNNSDIVIAWESNHQDGNQHGIYMQRFDSNGNPLGVETLVNTTTTSQQRSVAGAALNDGGYVLTWESEDIDGDGYAIVAQRFNASGQTVGGEFQVNSYTTDHQTEPSVTALQDGGFMIVWMSHNQDGNGSGIFGQRFDSNGNTVDNELQVNDYVLDDQNLRSEAITTLSDGSVVVTWESWNQDSDGWGVYSKKFTFNAGANPLSLDGDNTANIIQGDSGNDTITGFDGNDQLFGMDGDDILSGGDNNDYIDGGAGADTISAGNDNDIIVYDSFDIFGSTTTVDGGTGTDTLLFDGTTPQSLDLTAINDNVIQNIEIIDISGQADNTLELSIDDAIALSSETDEVIVRGDFGDTVNATGGWISDGQQDIDGVTYNKYTGNSGGDTATLFVDVEISDQIIS